MWFLFKVSEDGVLTLDTLTGGLDDGLNSEGGKALEEEFSILDNIGGTSIVNNEGTGIRKDPTILINEDDIENIVKSVRDEAGKSPSIIMVTNQEDAEENIAVRFLPSSQVAGSQGGPIVVINIHADSLGLGGRDGDLDISDLDMSDLRTKLLKNTKLAPAEIKESIPKELDENDSEDETKDGTDIPDYLDFDTDYITITMETDYQDGR
jgi:hypothetical protein